MKLHALEQGSVEWMMARLGIPTASNFNRILTSSPTWTVWADGEPVSRHRSEGPAEKKRDALVRKGAADIEIRKAYEPSTQGRGYLRELLAEWATGEPVDAYESQAMLRGRHLEPEAVAYYEMTRDVSTHDGGFCTTDDGACGASPDRLVYDGETLVGGLEIKCPGPAVHLGYLLDNDDGIADDYRHQVQGCMWITGLEWWDTLSYHPDLPPALVRIERDPEWGGAFADVIASFLADLEAGKHALIARGFKPRKDSK